MTVTIGIRCGVSTHGRTLSRSIWRAVAVLAVLLLQALPTPVAAQYAKQYGRMLSVGSQSWWMSCAGRGSPLVLLEAGHNESSETWRAVQSRISAFTRVCSYDRAGLGNSTPPSQRNRTGRDVAQELSVLLSAIDTTSKVVLVGHSLGGAFARLYASAFPGRVNGLVLIDAVNEREVASIDSLLTPAQRAATAGMKPISQEGIDIEATLAALRDIRRPVAPEVVVIARGLPLGADEMPPDWTPAQRQQREAIRVEMQRDLARLSRNGRFVVAQRSGHFVHHDEPDVVVNAIRALVDRLR